MEEEKKEPKVEGVGQKKLPPRPMPPRPQPSRPMPPRPMPPRPPMQKVTSASDGDISSVQNSTQSVGSPKSPVKTVEESVIKTNERSQRRQDKRLSDVDKDTKRAGRRAGKSFDKKKFWIILSCVLAGIGLVVGLVFLILSLIPAKSLDAPNNLMISQNNAIVFATCDSVDGATKYTFEIDGKKYDSKTPSLDLSNFLEPKEYSIRVFASGKKIGSLSKASKTIVYDLRKILQTPSIHFYESGSSVICWQQIEHATSYELFYNNTTKDVRNELNFDLKTLGGGAYNVQVRAKSTQSGWVESNLSNVLNHEVFETLQSPSGRILSGGKIEIGKVENASRYEVTINAKTFGVEKFEDGKIMINLIDAHIEPNTLVTYFKIEAIGENYFISNSAELDTTICEA